MSTQKSGWSYIFTISGGLKVTEEVCQFTLIVTLAVNGYDVGYHLLNFIAIVGFFTTGVLLALHIRGVVRKRSQVPWHWSECLYTALHGTLYVAFTSVVIVLMSPGFVATSILGYITAIIYWIDTVDKYKLATVPRKNYVWTTPNMPELNVQI